MKITQTLVILACALWEAYGFPYSPYYGNMDTLTYGSSDNSRGGMVLSRYYNPYYQRAAGGGMAAFMYKPEEQAQQYYSTDRRRQTQPDAFISPQQNEVYYPQQPENPIVTEATEIADPTEKTEVFSTTLKVSIPEITEPEVEEVEEPVQKPKKTVGAARKKQVKRPVYEEEDEESYLPRMPTGAFFPMFFGYGGGRSGGAPSGPIAISNAFSTSRGGVATSHATAYDAPRPEEQKL